MKKPGNPPPRPPTPEAPDERPKPRCIILRKGETLKGQFITPAGTKDENGTGGTGGRGGEDGA